MKKTTSSIWQYTCCKCSQHKQIKKKLKYLFGWVVSICSTCCQIDEDVFFICWCFFYLHVFFEVAACWALSATIHLSVYPTIHKPSRLFVCLSIYQSICLSFYLSLSIHLSIALSVRPSIHHPSTHPPTFMSIHLSIHLFICPSIHPSQLVLTNFAILVKVGWISNAFEFYFFTFKIKCQYMCKSEHTYFSQRGWRFFLQGFPHCWRLCSCRRRHQWEWRTGEWGTRLGSWTAEEGIQGTATSWL